MTWKLPLLVFVYAHEITVDILLPVYVVPKNIDYSFLHF